MHSPSNALHPLPRMAWPRYLATTGIVLPGFLFVVSKKSALPLFSPQQVVHSNDLFPLLVAPWAGPTTPPGLFSRLLQAVLLWRMPTFPASHLAHGYCLWIAIALARTLVGFLLTRSVGWAFPRLFSHHALYEVSSGYGPLLLGSLLMSDRVEVSKVFGCQRHLQYLVVGLALTLCWMDMEPWTYGIASLIVGVLLSIQSVISHTLTKARHPLQLNPFHKNTGPQSPSTKIRTVLALISLIALTNTLTSWIYPMPQVPMPGTPFPPARLLDIVVLSYPRPDKKATKTILANTLESYLPLLSSTVGLAVFTHAIEHPAFDDVRESIGSSQNILFYRDTDTHADAHSGQYLHLAEAFRWQAERGLRQAEWVMLVEDDFPLCGKEAGQNALRTVMKLLEDGREDQNAIPRRRGAFIGTGGRCIQSSNS